MGFCELEAGKIYFETHGKGEPLLILRGLGRSCRYWLGFERVLAQHFRVIMLDQRGIGRSTAPMGWRDTFETLATDCLQVMDQLRIKRFHLFGLSLGGMVAMSLTAQAPQRVRSLVIANSSSADYVAFRMSPLAIKDLFLAVFQGAFHETLMRQVIPAATLKSRGPEILQAWQTILHDENFPLGGIVKQLWASSRFSIRGRLNGLQPPTMVLCGSLDRLVPRYNSRRLHQLIPGSTFHMMKGAGHEISLGHEQECSRLLQRFMLGSR